MVIGFFIIERVSSQWVRGRQRWESHYCCIYLNLITVAKWSSVLMARVTTADTHIHTWRDRHSLWCCWRWRPMERMNVSEMRIRRLSSSSSSSSFTVFLTSCQYILMNDVLSTLWLAFDACRRRSSSSSSARCQPHCDVTNSINAWIIFFLRRLFLALPPPCNIEYVVCVDFVPFLCFKMTTFFIWKCKHRSVLHTPHSRLSSSNKKLSNFIVRDFLWTEPTSMYANRSAQYVVKMKLLWHSTYGARKSSRQKWKRYP